MTGRHGEHSGSNRLRIPSVLAFTLIVACNQGPPFLSSPLSSESVNPSDDPQTDSTNPPIVNTQIGALEIFPPDNPWNQDISVLPVHSNSANFINSIGANTGLHPDFGTVWEGAPIGIPYVVINGDVPSVPVQFYYDDESDPGPYPIPGNVPIEGGANSSGDRHIIVVDAAHRMLYELYDAYPAAGGWTAGSGAIYPLTSNALRPAGWTSADAAGLPIFPGLARYEEIVEQGELQHALRFTVSQTQRAYISPARHYASESADPDRPPMGLRLRLKADFDETPFPACVQVILRGLKRYGMMVADNGSNWYISGSPDSRWSDDELHSLGNVKGNDFEVVYTGDATRQ